MRLDDLFAESLVGHDPGADPVGLGGQHGKTLPGRASAGGPKKERDIAL